MAYDNFLETITSIKNPILVAKNKIVESLESFTFLEGFFTSKNPAVRYLNKFFQLTLELALLVISIWLISLLILYVAGMMWYLYTDTPMGKHFLSNYGDTADTIVEISEYDQLYFSVDVVLTIFFLCIGFSTACQFLHISYLFFYSMGFIHKLFLWGMPITAGVAYYIQNYVYGFSSYEVTVVLVMIPTYMMFISCFNYSQKLIPELGAVISVCTALFKKCVSACSQIINQQFKN